jgi:hypothetical protein
MEEVGWNDAVTLASPYPYALGVTLAPDRKPNVIASMYTKLTAGS